MVKPDMTASSIISRGLCAALVLASMACSPKELDIQLAISTRSCMSPAPLEGATHLRVKVTGEDMAGLLALSPLSGESRSLAIPEIPAGKGRRIEVRAYDGEPSLGGTVLALGQTALFDVPEVLEEETRELSLSVVLRRVNLFLRPHDLRAPDTCSRLRTARAGHASTLLPDGRVLITGGYELSGGKKTALYDSEFFNPEKGVFEVGPPVGLLNREQSFTPIRLAFHSSTLLQNGKVLLWGGEEYGSSQEVIPRARKLILDLTQNTYGQVFTESSTIGRSRHAAILEKSGRVLVLGGQSKRDGAPTTSVESILEWLDPTALSTSTVGGISLPRLEMGAASVQGGSFVAVAGGTDGTSLKDEILFFEFQNSTFVQPGSSAGLRLSQARRGVAMAPFKNQDTLLVAGGYTDLLLPKASGRTDIVTTGGTRTVATGPELQPRGDLCLVGLPDGRVLAVGGRSQDTAGGGLSQSEPHAELLTPEADGSTTVTTVEPLKTGVYHHTCTLLQDGSVLVLGGVTESKGTQSVLQDSWLFVPAPLD